MHIVCHIADFELVYADRLKRVVAEDEPMLFGGDPNVFAAKLAYNQRDLEEELDVIMSVRREVARFLKTLQPARFRTDWTPFRGRTIDAAGIAGTDRRPHSAPCEIHQRNETALLGR